MLGLGTAAVGGGAFLERQDEGFGDVSDPELRHGLTISHITRENTGRQAVEDGRSGE